MAGFLSMRKFSRFAGIICAAGILSCAVAGAYTWSRPAPSPVAPEDAALQRQWDALGDATPESLSQLEAQVTAARARLPHARDFETWMAGWSENWTRLVSATDRDGDLERRRYALAYNHPTLRAWPDIVRTVKTLCAEPGLTLDSLSLSAAPDGSDAFVQAQITLTARLRP